jgi:putative DNA primase/helicase
VLPHTPRFFAHHALAFPFVADALEPVLWLKFLRQLWPGDPASIDALQELFGYVIGGDTRQQKIFLLVGPRRGGKGVIGRVLTGILGRHNVAAPTLASLSTNFGLAPLIGKPLALISDARLSAKADAKVVVERLLSISGEDSLTIDRKYREPWTGRLPSRFVICTNELPQLADASGALSSRFVLLMLSESFLGREDPGLTDALLAEAPSILKWSLDGLDRLTRRGHLAMPEAGNAAVRQLEDLAAPVAAFVRERCTVRPDVSVEVEVLWVAWKEWCANQGRGHGIKAVFGRDLHAAFPAVRKTRPRDGAEREYCYEGISVATTLDNCYDHPDHQDQNPAGGPSGPGGPSNSPMYSLHGENPDAEPTDTDSEVF